MLREGQRLRKQGVDVAIGIVETHGRAREPPSRWATSRSSRPRAHRVPGRDPARDGTSTPSWRGGPSVCLVDELAHTDAPRGAGHAKRYQDVEELLPRRPSHVINHGQHPAPGEPLTTRWERANRRQG